MPGIENLLDFRHQLVEFFPALPRCIGQLRPHQLTHNAGGVGGSLKLLGDVCEVDGFGSPEGYQAFPRDSQRMVERRKVRIVGSSHGIPQPDSRLWLLSPTLYCTLALRRSLFVWPRRKRAFQKSKQDN